jgi:hydrogenase expression/formation protein HypE
MNNKTIPSMEGPVCPVPLPYTKTIVMGHGSGGKMMNDLIRDIFLPPLDNPILRIGDDAGVVEPNPSTQLAISTDCHVVSPLFFPGGDIGKLAVCGTVNDVAMLGATPQYLTAGFILEEGLEIGTLELVVQSMKSAAEEADVQIVAGDTKVVQRGKADGLYITTAGIGTIKPGLKLGGSYAKPGDVVIISGPIGDHGIAVLGARGELGFETSIQSDCAPLNHLINDMLDANDDIHVLRDPTRGGVASVLNEIAVQSKVGITIFEANIPVRPSVQAACEMLGFDPLYIANEGKLITIAGREDADLLVERMRKTKYGEGAVIIGEVHDTSKGRVLLRTNYGSTRVVDLLSGEILPRIC